MKRIYCLYFPSQRAAPIQALAEACYALTPQIALGHSTIFLEVTQGLTLFPEKELLRNLQTLAASYRANVRIAAAAHPAHARALAYFRTSSLTDLPLSALFLLGDPFVKDLPWEKSVFQLVSVLRKLGVKRLADFQALPSTALPARFGAVAEGLQRELRGGNTYAWPRFAFAETIVEGLDLTLLDDLGPCGDLQTLAFLVKQQLDNAFWRLRVREQKLSAFELKLTLDDRSERVFLFKLAVPQSGAPPVLAMIRERLQFELAGKPLNALLTGFQLSVLETAPAFSSQRDFFQRDEEEKEQWEALLARLWGKLGPQAVFRAQAVARYLPEKAWQPAADSPPLRLVKQTAPVKIPERPSRLLPRPEPLLYAGEKLVHPRYKKVWVVREWRGPERLSGEWWRDRNLLGFGRDYYQVLTEGGVRLWVFESIRSPGIYLHGYFD